MGERWARPSLCPVRHLRQGRWKPINISALTGRRLLESWKRQTWSTREMCWLWLCFRRSLYSSLTSIRHASLYGPRVGVPCNSPFLLGEKEPHPFTHIVHPLSLSSVDPLCESGIRGNMPLVIPWQHLQCAIVSVKINWQEIRRQELSHGRPGHANSVERDKIHMLVTNMAMESSQTAVRRSTVLRTTAIKSFFFSSRIPTNCSCTIFYPFLNLKGMQTFLHLMCPCGIWHHQLNICYCTQEPSRMLAFKIGYIWQSLPDQWQTLTKSFC